MSLTPEQLAKSFASQGFVFQPNDPNTLSRFTIMEKNWRGNYRPITLAQLYNRNRWRFYGIVEKNLLDGNVLCYDSRTGHDLPCSINIDERGTASRTSRYNEIPAPELPPPPENERWKRFAQIFFKPYRAELKRYDDALRLNEQRQAQEQHFDNDEKKAERVSTFQQYESERCNFIESCKEAGTKRTAIRADIFSEKFPLPTDPSAQADYKHGLNAIEKYKESWTVIKPGTGAFKYDDRIIHSSIAFTGNQITYSSILKEKPFSYREALANPENRSGFQKHKSLPDMATSNFYLTLIGPDYSHDYNHNSHALGYDNYFANIGSLLNPKANEKKVPLVQNVGANELWYLCNQICQNLQRKIEDFRMPDSATDINNQLSRQIPLASGSTASANLSSLTVSEVNSHMVTLLNETYTQIRCLKSFATALTLHSNTLTPKNQETLETCGKLAQFAGTLEAEILQGHDSSKVRLENFENGMDPEIRALLNIGEVRVLTFPLKAQEDAIQRELDREKEKAISLNKEPDRIQQQRIDEAKEEAIRDYHKKEHLRMLKLKQDEAEKIKNERALVEAEKASKRQTEDKLKFIWDAEDLQEKTALSSLSRGEKQTFFTEKLQMVTEEKKLLQEKNGKSYEDELQLKHLTQKVSEYQNGCETYSDYANAVYFDLSRRPQDVLVWKKDRETRLLQENDPQKKSKIDKNWRVSAVFAPQPRQLDLDKHGCAFNQASLTQHSVVLNEKQRIFKDGRRPLTESEMSTINLCATICAPYNLQGSKVKEALIQQAAHDNSPKPGELWVASGLLEYALDGKKPPDAISKLLPDAMEEGRKYAKEVLEQCNTEKNDKLVKMQEESITIMTKMLCSIKPEDLLSEDSSWQVTAKCLRDTLELYKKTSMTNVITSLKGNVKDLATGWSVAYTAFENDQMRKEMENRPEMQDREYLKDSMAIWGKLQVMCLQDSSKFDEYSNKQPGTQAEKSDPLLQLQQRSNYPLKTSREYSLGVFALDSTNEEKLQNESRSTLQYRDLISAQKNEREAKKNAKKQEPVAKGLVK